MPAKLSSSVIFKKQKLHFSVAPTSVVLEALGWQFETTQTPQRWAYLTISLPFLNTSQVHQLWLDISKNLSQKSSKLAAANHPQPPNIPKV